jgi:hypothetical protein
MQTVTVEFSETALPAIELSRITRLDEITNTATTIVVDANARECAALADRFDLPYVRNLTVEIIYRRTRGGQMVRIDGRISANYGQLCSVTMVPMAMVMEEEFQTEYTLSAWEKVSEFDLDQPEVLTDDFIDLGEVAAQYFGLAIDPWARRAGAETLAELTESITETVQALAEEVNSHANGHINGSSESAAMPGLKTVEFAAVPEDIQAFSAPANDIPAAEPEEKQAEPRESLFFQYLRRLQSK